MATIKGHREHLARLERMPKLVQREVGKAVFVGADVIGTEVRRLIVQNAIQGKGHVPSRPGEPPNRDTGNLDGSIGARKTGPMQAEMFEGGKKAPYAVFLEFGTTTMAERPHLRPATATKRKIVVALVRAAVERAVTTSGGGGRR